MDWADHTDAAAAAAGQQSEARQQQPAPASQQQHWQQPQWQLQHTGGDRQTTSDWAGGLQQSGPHHQREQSLPGASALVLDGGRSTAGAWATQQQQQRSVSAGGDKAAELAQELRAVEGHPDPGVRQGLVKEVKQQIYKVWGHWPAGHLVWACHADRCYTVQLPTISPCWAVKPLKLYARL